MGLQSIPSGRRILDNTHLLLPAANFIVLVRLSWCCRFGCFAMAQPMFRLKLVSPLPLPYAKNDLILTNKTASVCGSDIVNKYNDAMYMIGRNGSSEPSIDESGVKDVQSEVKRKTGYEKDATCQTLLFWIAIHNNDYSAAKIAATAVKELHDKGQFADNNIRGNDPILTYDPVLYGISPEAKEKAGAS